MYLLNNANNLAIMIMLMDEMPKIKKKNNFTDTFELFIYITGESEAVTEKKKTSTLGRLFRNMGFRRSSRKHSYKKHQGI